MAADSTTPPASVAGYLLRRVPVPITDRPTERVGALDADELGVARWRAAFVNRFWCLLCWEGDALGAAAGTAVHAAKQRQSGDDFDANRVDATLLPFALEGSRSEFHACTQAG